MTLFALPALKKSTLVRILFAVVFFKLESPEENLQSNKRQRTLKDVLNEGRSNSSYHPTMGHVVAICHARIPFIQLREEVNMH